MFGLLAQQVQEGYLFTIRQENNHLFLESMNPSTRTLPNYVNKGGEYTLQVISGYKEIIYEEQFDFPHIIPPLNKNEVSLKPDLRAKKVTIFVPSQPQQKEARILKNNEVLLNIDLPNQASRTKAKQPQKKSGSSFGVKGALPGAYSDSESDGFFGKFKNFFLELLNL